MLKYIIRWTWSYELNLIIVHENSCLIPSFERLRLCGGLLCGAPSRGDGKYWIGNASEKTSENLPIAQSCLGEDCVASSKSLVIPYEHYNLKKYNCSLKNKLDIMLNSIR
jgi:hypothetical protein